MAEFRKYKKNEVVTIGKTTSKFGQLSNMATSFSIFINEVCIPSSEALYQACKFPLNPDIQFEIISQTNPFMAKKVAYKYCDFIRKDWDTIKFDVMRWCLKVKFLQHTQILSDILKETEGKEIVEYSNTDTLWGASPIDNYYLQGVNALGRLLMELREQLHTQQFTKVIPPKINGFLLFGQPITTVYNDAYYLEELSDTNI